MTSTENRQVLNLVQALLGSISPNMRSVSLVCANDAVTLHFTLERESADDREEIDYVAFEFEALQDSPATVNVDYVITVNPGVFVSPPGRSVYISKGG